MKVFLGKKLDELSDQELKDYKALVENTVAQLTLELKSGSKTRIRDAEMRLSVWEDKQSEIHLFRKP